MIRGYVFCRWVLFLAMSLSCTAGGSRVSADGSLADLLDTMFDPTRAPAQKTMGLLQRDFIDLAQQAGNRVQVAFVVDGTESMAKQLAAVRSVLRRTVDDLTRLTGGANEYALVIYRDAQAPSGEVSLPRTRFTDDRGSFLNGLEAIQPEKGTPYFHELPDLGVHTALSQLNWSDDANVGKWIFLFADAPPYAADFEEPKTTARRRFDTQVLVNLAKQNDVRVNTVLCESDQSEFDAFQRCLPATRDFLNQLSAGTNGVMLDLSYDDVRQALALAAQQPRVPQTAIVPIRFEEVRNVATEEQTIKIAILPFITAGNSVDDIRPQMESQLNEHGLLTMEGEEFTFASELQFKLSQLPGVRLRNSRRVEQELSRLRSRPGDLELHLRRLSDRLDADYLLYGFHLQNGDKTSIRSALFVRDTGVQVRSTPWTMASRSDPKEQITLVSATESAVTRFATQQIRDDQQQRRGGDRIRLVQALADETAYRGVEAPISYDPIARRAFLQATLLLERALGKTASDPESMAFLEAAGHRIAEGLQRDESNPIGNSLDAACALNRAQVLMHIGKESEAASTLEQAQKALVRAHRHQEKSPNRWMEVEISGDYYLLRDSPDHARAIELYTSLTTNPLVPDYLRLRGHWMLAGIYAGDWGVPQDFIDATKAREHVVRVIGGWPNSHQADLLKRYLRWSDETGSSFAYLPRTHAWLAKR